MGQLEAYYELIWSRVAGRYGLDDLVMGRVAACLSLSPTRVSGAMLAAVIPDGVRAKPGWEQVLRMVRPLVVEESGGWRLFHNDVRVFLVRRLMSDASLYSDCASRIADFIRTDGEALVRHESLQDLLGIAGRYADQAKVFSPEYVIEGHAIGRPTQSLIAQGLVAADALTRGEADWELAHGVACGLRTVVQLAACLDWRADEPESRAASGSTVGRSTRGVERGVKPIAEWTKDVLVSALEDIQELLVVGESERAKAAFQRWFGELSPVMILSATRTSSCPCTMKTLLPLVGEASGRESTAVGEIERSAMATACAMSSKFSWATLQL